LRNDAFKGIRANSYFKFIKTDVDMSVNVKLQIIPDVLFIIIINNNCTFAAQPGFSVYIDRDCLQKSL
jgi:hypothetical protein